MTNIMEHHVSPYSARIYSSSSSKADKVRIVWSAEMKSLHKEFRILNTLFKLTGISLAPSKEKSFGIRLFFQIMAGISAVFFLCIVAEVLYCGIIALVKPTVVAFNIIVLFLSLFLWITLFRSRHQITKLVKKLIFSSDTNGKINKTSLNKKIRMLLAYICFLPIFVSLTSFSDTNEASLDFYLHCYLYGCNLSGFKTQYKEALLLLFLTIENFVHFLFPNLVIALIYLLLEEFYEVLNMFIKQWRLQITKVKFDCGNHMLKIYGNIRKDFDVLHKSVTNLILLLLAQKFLTLFFSLTVILSSSTKKIFIEILESGLFSLNAIVTLILLIMSASKIYETHKMIRTLSLETLLSNIHRDKSFPDIKETDMLFLMRTFVEKEDMLLTGAGIIPLTRALFLQIVAALITYGVLIVQMDN